jgi:hypothetical protein
MKSRSTLLLLIISLAGLTSSHNAYSQNEYFREGFEAGNTFPTADLPPQYVTGSSSGTWYINGIIVTNGSATNNCAAPAIPTIGISHARLRGGTFIVPPDTAYLVTPVLDFGIQNLNFINGRSGRNFTIWKTPDTLATTTNWTLVSVLTSPAICQLFTTVAINDANAKRLKIQSRGDSDVDSVWITSTSTITPVHFSGMTAIQASGKIKVSWNVATEENTARYAVERSSNGASFSEVGSVAANNAKGYVWYDNSPLQAASFYRIKAIDKNGSSMYTSIVRINSLKSNADIAIAPNPVKGNLVNLQLSSVSRGAYTVSVTNSIGQQVFTKSLSHEGGSATYQLQLPSSIKSGVYNLQVKDGETVINKKVVVE